MGILNVTPDSFSDGGRVTTAEQAIARVRQMIAEGVDVVDVGAESTRPGAEAIDAATELARLQPIIQALRRAFPQLPLSIDTYKATVATACIAAGADLVNDVEGARFEADSQGSPMAQACARLRCPLILMHRRQGMDLADFWPQLLADLRGSIRLARTAGIPPEQLWLDPGFGFGKSPAQNLELVRTLHKVTALGYPVLLGTSRKSTLGLILNQPDPLQRQAGNIATAIWGIAQGCAMLRVHDVGPHREVVQVADALRRSPRSQS